MIKQFPTTTPVAVPAHTCPCGCAPCDKQCCELECLVRPDFFCGQLLTDADLTALVQWNRAHQQLGRFLHGWGVVCGLNLSCDPHNPTSILIQPGYAVDSCGNAIVVCEPASHSLAKLCPQGECLDLYAEQQRSKQQLRERANRLLLQVDRLKPEQRETLAPQIKALQEVISHDDSKAHEAAINVLEEAGRDVGLETPPAESLTVFERVMYNAQAVDLFLHYDEHGSEPQQALRGNACGPSECHNSRIREGHRLSWQVVMRGVVPESPWDGWRKLYNQRRDKATMLYKSVRSAAEAGDLKSVCAALTIWLNDPSHQPGPLCFAQTFANAICKLAPTTEHPWQSRLPELVFWLIVDDLLAWLTCGCPGYDTATGIPLGRVWLASENARTCQIVAIDTGPPRRRPIQRDPCLPSRPNQVDPARPGIHLGHLLGRHWDSIQQELHDLGFEGAITLQPIDQHELTRSWDTVELLLNMQAEELAPFRTTKTTALAIDLGAAGGMRIFGFKPA